jgi:hypothetical protein
MGFGGHINENIWRVFSRQRWEFMVEILEVMSLIPFMVCLWDLFKLVMFMSNSWLWVWDIWEKQRNGKLCRGKFSNTNCMVPKDNMHRRNINFITIVSRKRKLESIMTQLIQKMTCLLCR